MRPFALTIEPGHAAMISEVEGVFVIEPMRFLWPYEARREANRKAANRRPTINRVQHAGGSR